MKYKIIRNEMCDAYAKATYIDEANSIEEAKEKLTQKEAKLESYKFDSWNEDYVNFIDDDYYWEVVKIEDR